MSLALGLVTHYATGDPLCPTVTLGWSTQGDTGNSSAGFKCPIETVGWETQDGIGDSLRISQSHQYYI